MPKLPDFIQPMLCKPGHPFDSDEYLYEIKWDGTRTLCLIEDGKYRLVNRRQLDMTFRYPEFEFLGNLPAGIVLDGEMVVFKNNKSDFNLLLSREQCQTPFKIKNLAKSMPATYVVFDILYANYQSLMDHTLEDRRSVLKTLVEELKSPRLVLSDGVVGSGKAFFESACKRDLEGIVAKRLKSPYYPGKRTDAWIKIKRGGESMCAIIGFQVSEDRKDDFRSLILATEEEGELRYAGKVGTGFDREMHEYLNNLLWARLRKKPIVPCKLKGKWIDPGLFCKVSYMERTESGEFRAPVFEELYEDPSNG